MEYNLHNNVNTVPAINNGPIIANGTTTGNVIDTAGSESLEYVIQSGIITDGVYNFVLEEDDVLAFTSPVLVPVDNVLGSLTGFVVTDNNTSKRVGTIGKKRYQRLTITASAVTTGMDTVSAAAVLGHPKHAAVA